jgi:hypothetical protein
VVERRVDELASVSRTELLVVEKKIYLVSEESLDTGAGLEEL